MRPSPFIDDPRDALSRHVKSAVDSPIEEVVAIHLEQAIHQAAIARESGLLPPTAPSARKTSKPDRPAR